MEEGIIQENEHGDRRRDDLGGLEEIDILTPSPDEPQQSGSSTSQSELSQGAGWMSRFARPWREERRRRQEAETKTDRDIAAAVAHDQCRTIEELDRALALGSPEERRWEEHRDHLERLTEAQAASEAVVVAQLQDEMDQFFDQLLQNSEEPEAAEEAETVQSSPRDSTELSSKQFRALLNTVQSSPS